MTLYDELQIRPVINAYGTVTPYGGVLMAPEVLDAMIDASQQFVDVSEFAAKGGRHAASLLGFPDGLVVAGASAGLTIATAAALCGSDPVAAAKLPKIDGTRKDVLVQRCQRTPWSQAVRLAGAEVVEVGSESGTEEFELESALCERTAAVLYYAEFASKESMPLARMAGLAKEARVPVIVDAAAVVPPVGRLQEYWEDGASVTIVSGGKLLGGPASSGLALGSSEMMHSMRAHSSPNMAVGRPMKVGKEEIAGISRAVQIAVDHESDREEQWARMARSISEGLSVPRNFRSRYVDVGEDLVLPRSVPRIYVEWDEDIGLVGADIAARLLEGEPSVAVGFSDTRISVNPTVLTYDQVDTVIARLNAVLTEMGT